MGKSLAWTKAIISAFWVLWIAYGITNTARHHHVVMSLIGVPILVLWVYLLSVDIRSVIAVHRKVQ